MVRQRHHLPDPQSYAIDQFRDRHEDALYHYGEYAMFVLMWRISDHESGLVDRCSVCYLGHGEIAEAYGQSADPECSFCFGTTFEGGYKAKIVRPSIWADSEEDHRKGSRGEFAAQTASVQATSDFVMRTSDAILRGDGTRWQALQKAGQDIRTGFQMPSPSRSSTGMNYNQVVRQHEGPVFHIPPTDPDELQALLDVPPGTRWPKDWSDVDEVRGPLL